jgi:hypothetical protein
VEYALVAINSGVNGLLGAQSGGSKHLGPPFKGASQLLALVEFAQQREQ